MHQDFNGMDSELEWMLQSAEIEDALLIEALIHKYYAGLYQLTLSVTENPQAATRAAGQAITSAVSMRHRYSGEYSLRVWLYSLGCHLALKSAQKRQWAAPTKKGDKQGSGDVSKSLSSLDKKHSLPVILRYVHGLSLTETSHILGLRERTVHARLNEVRRVCLSALFPGSEKEPPHPDMIDFMREALDGMLEGKNSFEYQARLEMHLDECRDCTAYSALLKKVEEQIRHSAPQQWPILDPSEAELKAAHEEMLLGAGRQRKRQSLTLSVKTFSLAGMVVAILALLALSTGIFERIPPDQLARLDNSRSQVTQPAQANRGSENTRTLPRPTGVGPTTARDGFPLLSGDFLPPRINLRLSLQDAVLPQVIESLGWNNSGPLSLFNVLGYWGWQGELEDILADLQPDLEEQHVTPEEMVDYIYNQTGLASVWRFGGDLETLKLLLAGGYPVIVAKGADDPSMTGWFAHYAIVHGYNEKDGVVRLMDLLLAETKAKDLAYEDFIRDWREMNYTFLVVYPSHQEGRLFELLGQYADEKFALRTASRMGSSEARILTGRDKFFAAFNHGTSHAYLDEYSRAASAFDEAFEIYMSLPEDERPWRILWYETSPYRVYHEIDPSGEFSQSTEMTLADSGVGYSLDDEDCRDMQEEMSGDSAIQDGVYSDTNGENILRMIVCAQQ